MLGISAGAASGSFSVVEFESCKQRATLRPRHPWRAAAARSLLFGQCGGTMDWGQSGSCAAAGPWLGCGRVVPPTAFGWRQTRLPRPGAGHDAPAHSCCYYWWTLGLGGGRAGALEAGERPNLFDSDKGSSAPPPHLALPRCRSAHALPHIPPACTAKGAAPRQGKGQFVLGSKNGRQRMPLTQREPRPPGPAHPTSPSRHGAPHTQRRGRRRGGSATAAAATASERFRRQGFLADQTPRRRRPPRCTSAAVRQRAQNAGGGSRRGNSAHTVESSAHQNFSLPIKTRFSLETPAPIRS